MPDDSSEDKANQEINEIISDVSFGRYKKARMACSRLTLELLQRKAPKAWAKVIIEVVRLFIIIGNYRAALQTIHDVESLKEIPSDTPAQSGTPTLGDGKVESIDDEVELTIPIQGSPNIKNDLDRETQELDLVFELQTAFCKAIRDGKFKNLEKPFEKGLKWISQGEIDSKDITRYTVLVISYITKLVTITKTLKYPESLLKKGTIRADLTKTIELLVNKLQQSNRVNEAHILIQSLNTLAMNPKEKINNLLQLLEHWGNHDSPALLADIYLDIVEVALELRQKHLAKSYVVLALIAYNSVQHILGIKKTLYLQIKLTDDYDDGVIVNSSRINFYAIKELCNVHEKIEDGAGILSLYMDWMEMARVRADFDGYLILSDDLYQMAKQMGLNVPCMHTRAMQIAFFLSRTANTAKTLECIDAVLEDAVSLELPYIHGLLAYLASRAYGAMDRQEAALKFAEIALEKLRPCGPESESMARFQIIQCQKDIIDKSSKQSGGRFQRGRLTSIAQATEELIDMDIKGGMYSEAAEKLLYLASIRFEEFDKPGHTRSELATAALDRAINYSSRLGRRGSKQVLASALQLRATQILMGPGIPTPERRQKSLRDLQRALEYFQQLKMWYQTAAVKQAMGLICQNQNLLESLNHFEAAYSIYEKMGQTIECIGASSLALRTCYSIWKLTGFSKDVSPSLLEALERTSKWLDYRRSELSSLGGLQAIIEKQSLARDYRFQNLGEIAVHYCVESWSAEQAWYWVQKQKARSVSDLMGLGYSSDQYSTRINAESEQVASLLEEHTRLLSKIRDASPGNRLFLRATHARLLERMTRHAELKELLHLQLGQPIEFDELESIFLQDTGFRSNEIVLVDWFSTETDIYMISSRRGEPPRISKLDKSVEYVTQWIADNFTNPDDRENTLDYDPDDPDAPFRDLDFLISNLADLSRPGDLLVLAPSKPIHPIPLHALVLTAGNQSSILIKRNPVLYTPSLTILKHCISRAEKPRAFKLEGIRCAAVYEYPPTQSFRAAEQDMIKSNIEDLGKLLHTRPLWGEDCTKESLRSHFNGASLLHFHGHCYYDPTNILNHALVASGVYNNLAQRNQTHISTKVVQEDMNTLSHRILFLSQELEIPEYGSTIQSQDTGLSISEIFEVELNDPVVTIIACESASQQIGPGDEPLGLATAFLSAGASSYVGTIWEMPCKEARVFSTAFYENILGQKGARIVNLALALQSAIVRVMSIPQSRNYMYWAPLVLHGSWFCQPDIFWRNE
ncbi:uncharacterized protein DFL_009457 [Arthrobotrys flagrans]|uniref:CHAT domain-containing protein n=1 Tax=Arthrobotrys flagrans TaxID=97331 RepID=A0A436ZRP8_ARTFL|nr:hypothetical protein DFL_009457 [Arthrobotrys flagrans]